MTTPEELNPEFHDDVGRGEGSDDYPTTPEGTDITIPFTEERK